MKKRLFIGVFGLVLLAACAGHDSDFTSSEEPAFADGASFYDLNQEELEMTEDAVALDHSATTTIESPELLDRKLIKTAYLSFEVDSLEKRHAVIDRAVKTFGGYIQHEEQFAGYDRENITSTVRIPSVHFDDFIETATNGVGTFDSKNISMDDVTEEYIDVAARIETKKELKKRFIGLLDRAESIKKIMEVEREITILQEEIESYESRLKYLASSTKYATVSITYYRMVDVPIEYENSFVKAFYAGWQAIVFFLIVLVSIWPLVLIGSIIFILVRYRIKAKKKRQTT